VVGWLVGCTQNSLTCGTVPYAREYPQLKTSSTHSRSEAVSGGAASQLSQRWQFWLDRAGTVACPGPEQHGDSWCHRPSLPSALDVRSLRQ
jgi:hypothetical protein